MFLKTLLFFPITNAIDPIRKHLAIGIMSDIVYTGFIDPISVPNSTKTKT